MILPPFRIKVSVPWWWDGIRTCRQHPQRRLRRVAFRKERLADVEREGERLDGAGARPHDDALDPEPDERRQGPEGDVDVGVVGAGLLDHAAQLGVAVGAEHGENPAHAPDDQREVDRPERGDRR